MPSFATKYHRMRAERDELRVILDRREEDQEAEEAILTSAASRLKEALMTSIDLVPPTEFQRPSPFSYAGAPADELLELVLYAEQSATFFAHALGALPEDSSDEEWEVPVITSLFRRAVPPSRKARGPGPDRVYQKDVDEYRAEQLAKGLDQEQVDRGIREELTARLALAEETNGGGPEDLMLRTRRKMLTESERERAMVAARGGRRGYERLKNELVETELTQKRALVDKERESARNKEKEEEEAKAVSQRAAMIYESAGGFKPPPNWRGTLQSAKAEGEDRWRRYCRSELEKRGLDQNLAVEAETRGLMGKQVSNWITEKDNKTALPSTARRAPSNT